MRFAVYYHHTDAGGAVSYGAYLEFLEAARTEFLAARGVDVRTLAAQGRLFVVAHQKLDYRAPAGYGDTLSVDTGLVRARGVRIELAHRIRRQDGVLVAEAATTLALIDRSFRPRPLPEELLKCLEKEGAPDA